MSDELLTEDQEAERAKAWVRENGLFIVAGVVLGLGGLFGWQQWEDYQMRQSEQASAVWAQMAAAIDGERYNEVDETLTLLETDYAGTPYLDQARLAMAALHMNRNDPEAALVELDKVASSGNDPLLRKLAELRRAQVLNAEERYEEVLELLDENAEGGLASLQLELRGDALFGLGQMDAAEESYRLALNNDAGGVVDRSFVQMKLDQAAASAPVADTADDAGADE
ncbi:MAG: tetratricopeptide repeat protein [Gammaproteobacteria bacterium]|nr:tetratricopeptide repeat protein [Gammaproteobacteria bacterium]